MFHTNLTLRCPVCDSVGLNVAESKINCENCGRVFPVNDGIPDLRPNPDLDTFLDIADYDLSKEVSLETSTKRVNQIWQPLFAEFLTHEKDSAPKLLEIGCGSGNITLGLVESGTFQHVIASDISLEFLRLARSRFPEGQEDISFYQADANVLPFAPKSFEVIIGNSVLHHFIDYQTTISSCFEMLGESGIAIFGEPIFDGVAHSAYLAGLMAELMQREPADGDRKSDLDALNNIANVINTKLELAKNRERLAKIEDKWMFRIDDMRKLAEEIGFSRLEFRGLGHFNPEMVRASRFAANFMIGRGVSKQAIERYAFLFDIFDRTYGLLHGTSLPTQYGFFVFIK